MDSNRSAAANTKLLGRLGVRKLFGRWTSFSLRAPQKGGAAKQATRMKHALSCYKSTGVVDITNGDPIRFTDEIMK